MNNKWVVDRKLCMVVPYSLEWPYFKAIGIIIHDFLVAS